MSDLMYLSLISVSSCLSLSLPSFPGNKHLNAIPFTIVFQPIKLDATPSRDVFEIFICATHTPFEHTKAQLVFPTKARLYKLKVE